MCIAETHGQHADQGDPHILPFPRDRNCADCHRSELRESAERCKGTASRVRIVRESSVLCRTLLYTTYVHAH